MSQSGSKPYDAITVIKTDGDAVAPSCDLKTGDRIGPYVLHNPIGSGGMATVWAADDGTKTVALKLLPPDLAANPDLLARFRIEAQAAAALDHPAVATILDCGEANGRSFIAFELVPGETIRQIVDRRGSIDPALALAILGDAVDGLEHAHSRGIVHRDVKPANIIVTPDGRAVLIDMGLARRSNGLTTDGGVTVSGTTLGTFDYVSPEQAIDPRQADFRSDLYSLGCTLYHALTGVPPVPEGTAARKLHFHQHEKPLDPRRLNSAIPYDLACILSRLLAKNPTERYQTAAEVRADLAQARQSLTDPTGGSRLVPNDDRRPLSLILGLLLMAGALAIAFVPRDRSTSVPNPLALPAKPDSSPSDAADPPIRRSATDGSWIPADGDELAELLREGEFSIRLIAGRDYDLTNVGPVIVDHAKLIVESEPGPIPARIILPAQDDTLVIRDASSVEFRRITFRTVSVATERPDPKPSGIRIERVESFTVTGCRFELADDLRVGNVASLDAIGSKLIIAHCLFATGSVGIRIAGESSLTIRESGFGPHEAAIDLDDGRGTVALDHVTFLMRPDGGCAIDRGDESQYDLHAASCLFAPAGPPTASAMMMMGGRAAPAVLRSASLRPLAGVMPLDASNAYGRLDFAHIGDAVLSIERRSEIGWGDREAVVLPTSPWAESDPLAALADPTDPWRAFRVRLDLPAVRRPREVVFGVRFASADGLVRVYPGDWPPPRPPEFNDDPRKTWWPSAPIGTALPKNTARTLPDLLAMAKNGDIIEIRHDGSLPMPTVRWGLPGATLTLKPAVGSRPILVPNDAIKRMADGAMFELTDGELICEGLEAQLDPTDGRLAWIRQAGGTSVQMKRCIVTLDSKTDGTAVVRLTTSEVDQRRMSASTGIPKCRFEETFVRGRGQVVTVPTARPFQIEFSNTAIALDGAVVSIDAAARDAEGGRARMSLSRSTFAISGSLLAWTATGESRSMVPMEIEANANAFMAIGESKPLIRLLGTEPNATVESFLTWSTEKSNRYARYGRSSPMVAFDAGGIDRDEWMRRISHEPSRIVNRLKVAKLPTNTNGMLELPPADLAIQLEPGDDPVGADVDRLPTPMR